ncbi:MAG: hypothetical protein WC135_01545 [Bacteroidales bacterium]
MKTLFKVHYSKIVFISIIALFCSFTTNGQNYANEFLNKQNDTLTRDVVYLYVNPVITYRNESIKKIENFDKLELEIQNDLLKKYAPLINKVKDSLILSNFTYELTTTLSSLGFEVVLVSNPKELPKTIDPTHHTLNLAQIEVEEFSITDSLVYEGKEREVYYKLLNGVRFNSWLIYNESDINSRLVFYLDQEVQDFFDGEINVVDGSYFASYDYEQIRVEDAYLTANLTGTISAQYFFNFLMNKHVWIKSSGVDTNYYGIDIKSKKISSEGQPFDNFDIVDY